MQNNSDNKSFNLYAFASVNASNDLGVAHPQYHLYCSAIELALHRSHEAFKPNRCKSKNAALRNKAHNQLQRPQDRHKLTRLL